MPDTAYWCNAIARPFQKLAALFRPRRANQASPYTYVLASWAFLRLLGLVYVIAFGSLWLQLDGLIGREGIVPVAPLLAAAHNRLGIERWWQFPTLCWQGHSVFQCNTDEVQGRPRLGRETSAGCRHICVACPAHQSNDRVAQRGHDLRDIATPYLGAIFIKG